MTDSRNAISRQGVDWWSVGIFAVLVLLGWMNIYAAVSDGGEFTLDSRYGSQLIWIGVCAAVAAVVLLVDEIFYHMIAYPFYFFMLLVLAATLFLGTTVNGARSWLSFGGFSVQPAEFAKFATALALARYMSSYNFSMHNARTLATAMCIFAVPMIVILLQNDAGSALVFASFMLVFYREGLNGWVYVAIAMALFVFVFSFIWNPTMLLAAVIAVCAAIVGIEHGGWRWIVRWCAGVAFLSLAGFGIVSLIAGHATDYYWCLLAATGIGVIPVAVYAWKARLRGAAMAVALLVGSVAFTGVVEVAFDHLKLHQQKRILNLFGVEADPSHWGYNVNQSKIAIGSGGFFGKGYLQGTQTKYDFVPEQSTDFIFCTVGEEWGLLGSTVVLALFCVLILRLIRMGERQQEPFGRVYCYGVAAIFMFHVLINIGMTIGIMPVIGIPLPLFSYGGSSLLAFTMLFFVAVKLDSGRREGPGRNLRG